MNFCTSLTPLLMFFTLEAAEEKQKRKSHTREGKRRGGFSQSSDTNVVFYRQFGDTVQSGGLWRDDSYPF